jgi:hypothetical protein
MVRDVDKPIFESQELARRFNEDEAVWRRFEVKRKLRQWSSLDSLLSEELMNALDWLESERELLEIRYVGRALP